MENLNCRQPRMLTSLKEFDNNIFGCFVQLLRGWGFVWVLSLGVSFVVLIFGVSFAGFVFPIVAAEDKRGFEDLKL